MDAVVEQARLELRQARGVRQPLTQLARHLRNWAVWAATAVRLLYNSCMPATYTPFEHDCRVVARRIDLHERVGDAQISVGRLGSSTASDSPKLRNTFSGLHHGPALISPRSSTAEVISYHHLKRRQHRCTGALHSRIPRSVRLTAHHHSLFSSLVSGPSYLLYTRSIHSSDTRILHSSYFRSACAILSRDNNNTCQ